MKIYVQKIAMIRPDTNPKNSNLNLDIDWSVEYHDTDKDQIRFNMILKSLHQFHLDFKIEGVVELYGLEKFVQDDVSQLIFHKACSILMNMVSLTRQSTHFLSSPEDLSDVGREYISGTLFN